MVVEERIEAADRRKVDGNELFKEGKIAEAMQQYEMVTLNLILSSILFWRTHLMKETRSCIKPFSISAGKVCSRGLVLKL